MANAQGIRAGRAFVELFADDTRLVRGLNAASKRLKDWGESIGSVGKKMLAAGLGVLGSLAGAGKLFADMGSDLADMSARTGVSVEALSELGYAADMSGGDMETLEGGLRKMQKMIAEAASGSETARQSLSALGITIADLKDLSPDEQFMLIADRLTQIKNPTQRAAAAMEVFGKSGTRLLPMMADGVAGLEAMRQKARDLGLVMSSEDAAAADELGDVLDTMWKSIKRGAATIGAALSPTLQELAARVTSVMTTVGNWINQNRDVVVTVFKVAAAVAAGGAALIAIGGAVTGLGAVFGAVAAIITGVGTALGTIGAVLSAILSPVGLVIAALASLGGYFLYVSGAGQRALSWLGEQFAALRETALAAWQGISDALAAGDIGLAAKILWLTLKMEWQKGVAWLTEKWIGFKEAFMAVATEAVYGTAKILTSAWAGLQTAWVETVAFMSKAWTVFTSSLVTGWQTAQNWISKKLVSLMAMFDDSVDVEGAQKILDEDFQREQRGREQATQQQLRDIETARQSKRAAIDQEEQGTLDELNREKDARHAARQQQNDPDVKAAEDALAQARKQWQDALDEAARKRAEIAETPGPGRVKGPGDLEGLDLEGMGKKSISVQGTFNAMAAQGLGAGGPMERAARAGEETARNTRKLVVQAQHGGLQFA